MPAIDPNEDRPPSLLGELRRRRVLRVAGAYVLVAWILMQAGEIIFPAFELPTRALRALILSLGVGLPVVIVMAWVLDVTPTGIRLNRRLSSSFRGEPASDANVGKKDESQIAKSLEMLLLGVFVPVFAFVMLLTVLRSGRPVEDLASIPSSQSPSIAVLPFEDFSIGSEDKGFFARGMHEDILAQLSRVPGLKLISRMSVMPFADRKSNIRNIGRELGVGHILEGSVRRTKTQVRVTAQLIRVETDEHLWAQNFDADLENVFEVQSRIAEAIATALEAELIPVRTPSSSVVSSVVPGAYDAYLRARDIHRNVDTKDRNEFAEARHLYELALQSDDSLAAAWLQLGILHSQAYWFGFDRSDQHPALARKALDRSAELGVALDQLALAEGIYAYYVEHDFESALSRFGEAARQAPGNAEAHFYRAMILRRIGELEAAVAAQQKALALDPLNYGYREELVLTLSLAGHLEDALRENLDLLRREPSRPRARYQNWQLELELEGRPDVLLSEILAGPREHWREQHFSMLETVATLADRPDVAIEILAARPPANPDSGYRDYQLAVLEGLAGRSAERLVKLEQAKTKFSAFVENWPESMSEAERVRTEALFSAQAGDWERALRLQRKNVEAMPIDEDLIVGTPPLWLLLQFQLEAGRINAALETLARLHSKVALGSILYGGHYVLAHWPEFDAARNDPRVRDALEAIRPAYADNWPSRPTSPKVRE